MLGMRDGSAQAGESDSVGYCSDECCPSGSVCVGNNNGDGKGDICCASCHPGSRTRDMN